MSGHSKWSSIKHKKGAADAKRGKLFSKLSRAIIVAAKEGGPDPAGNLALQNAIEKARSLPDGPERTRALYRMSELVSVKGWASATLATARPAVSTALLTSRAWVMVSSLH